MVVSSVPAIDVQSSQVLRRCETRRFDRERAGLWTIIAITQCGAEIVLIQKEL